ncbi:hypothetical protein ATCR1_19621 [Agrobacterium tumefaciens CCNWGS0286]|nr:hypothetical protein ATCR1_19621 [Agrobacterium tumefaciens CCNWGS0286]
MTERWVAEVVCKTNCFEQGWNVSFRVEALWQIELFWIDVHEGRTKTARHVSYFMAMGQAGANTVMRIKGKDLGLVLHAPDRRREQNSVVVALEFGTMFGGLGRALCPLSFGLVLTALRIEQLFPLQITQCPFPCVGQVLGGRP